MILRKNDNSETNNDKLGGLKMREMEKKLKTNESSAVKEKSHPTLWGGAHERILAKLVESLIKKMKRRKNKNE